MKGDRKRLEARELWVRPWLSFKPEGEELEAGVVDVDKKEAEAQKAPMIPSGYGRRGRWKREAFKRRVGLHSRTHTSPLPQDCYVGLSGQRWTQNSMETWEKESFCFTQCQLGNL